MQNGNVSTHSVDTQIQEKELYKELKQYLGSMLKGLALQKGCRIEKTDAGLH